MAIFIKKLHYFLLQKGEMIYDDSPNYFRFQAVVTMNYKITGINDFSGGGNIYGWICFQYPIHSFTHDFNVSFYKFTKHIII